MAPQSSSFMLGLLSTSGCAPIRKKLSITNITS